MLQNNHRHPVHWNKLYATYMDIPALLLIATLFLNIKCSKACQAFSSKTRGRTTLFLQ